ncbi:MAG: hypothetical protein NVS9B10_24750 [Nevskia sp.]
MKFEDKHSYAKPAATLLKMYSDRAYFEKKYQAMPGVKDFAVLECETVGTKFHIKHKSMQKSDIPLPDFAKKFMAEYNAIVQQDSWDTATGIGRLDVEIKGVPIKLSAEMKVTGDKTATNTLNWNVSCSIPLLGGKLEKAIAEDIREKAKADAEVSASLLKDY